MKNDTYYFSHDYNARNDRKLIKVHLKFKMAGIGIYWSIIEMMYEENGQLPVSEIPTISAHFREKESTVSSIINDFDLFQTDGNFFWSESVKRRMDKRLEKSEKAKASAALRWQNANGMRTHSDGNAIKERKGKENKGKEIIEREADKPPARPSENLLSDYFIEIGLDDFTAQAQSKLFINHYTSNGWKVGKNPMKDWRAAARGWKDRIGNYKIEKNGSHQQAFSSSSKQRGADQLLAGIKNDHAARRTENGES